MCMTIKNIRFDPSLTAERKLEIASDIIRRFRLKGEEAELFLYLCSKPSGFCVSNTYVANVTSIDRNHVPRAREKLVRDNLIAVKNNKIIIDWRQLCGLLMIPDDQEVRTKWIHNQFSERTYTDPVRSAFGLDLPDVNPERLTYGCMVAGYEGAKMPYDPDDWKEVGTGKPPENGYDFVLDEELPF